MVFVFFLIFSVLNDIASVMLNELFLEEIFRPQKLYNKHELYLFFKQVVHASIMKLNDNSMGKLYDLMIMVFKYQIYFVSRPRDILLVTLNHLDSMRNLVSSSFIYKQLDVAYHWLTKVGNVRNSIYLIFISGIFFGKGKLSIIFSLTAFPIFVCFRLVR